MIIHVDLASATPPYDQVRAAIEHAITEGDLPSGTRLPTVRALAADLGLAPNTVARAYRELEALGLLVAQGRRGTFVADHAPATGAARDAADAFAARVRALGLQPDVALRLARTALGL
ncbi:MAG: GntR family transcriptional regulator [Acidimicrobiales bacterium]|nr:GntR family transcriptional regulator [Acidimicrobiales bacterium]